jgi:predicted N-acetyltransferase YhbS
MTLRKARPGDAGRLCEINADALGYEMPPEATWARLLSILENPAHFLYVAEEGGRVVGYIHACAFDALFYQPLKYVVALAVDPARQGRGAGRALMCACEAWARADGCAGVRLASGADRAGAHAFYRRLGYAVRKDQKSIWKLFAWEEAAAPGRRAPKCGA